MLRAVRTLQHLGPAAIVGLFGNNQEGRGERFQTDLAILEQLLGGGTYRSPAFQIGAPRSPGARQQEVYRRACLACLMAALNGQPKRAAEVALLLKSFALLPVGTGHRSEWVKRRYRLDARHRKGRRSELGSLVWLLRSTFEQVREHLAPEPVKPVSRDRLVRQARRWRVPVAVYERLFRDFCRLAPAKANAKGLKDFEVNLEMNSKIRGGREQYRKLLLQGSPSPMTTE